MALCREFTNASLPALGRAFNCHHTTSHNGISRSHDLMDAFPEYFDRRLAILQRLGIEGLN
jgi:chromosomal replication initiation ATPase DnaA